jgi:hypothetical protein
MFDGDVGRLTGTQLKQHIQSICGIPAAQQILTHNGMNVADNSMGYDLGLRDGSTLLLDTISRSGSYARGPSELRQGPPPPRVIHQPSASRSTQGSRYAAELDSIRRDAEVGSQSLAREYTPADRRAPATYSAAGVYDDVDLDVEIEEESGGPMWQPTNSVDVEESRLLQQDYIWKMEQVRFETERMNREREMMRQKQELDYQAELLERERIELERKTHAERLKLALLQATLQDEMSIEARISALTEESVYRNR